MRLNTAIKTINGLIMKSPLNNLVIPADDTILLFAFLFVFICLYTYGSTPVNKVFASHSQETLYATASKILKRMYVYAQSKIILIGFPRYQDAIYFGLFNSFKHATITPLIVIKKYNTSNLFLFFRSAFLIRTTTNDNSFSHALKNTHFHTGKKPKNPLIKYGFIYTPDFLKPLTPKKSPKPRNGN
jgi:hypothetical protein